MRGAVALIPFALIAGTTSPCFATAPGGQVSFDADSVSYQPPPTERRGGFAMAATLGYGIGVYRGYELSVDALNDPNGQKTTGPAVASQIALWFGGSPRDWLTAGLGLSLLSAQNESTASGMAFMAHVEFFPLYYLGGTFHDLGLGFDGGLGVATMFDKADKDFETPIAESGSLSTLGFSAFWEPWRAWHFSFGPTANYVYGFSQTMNVNQFTIGFRGALYGVQPKKKRGAS
jgi:hypothetical protein